MNQENRNQKKEQEKKQNKKKEREEEEKNNMKKVPFFCYTEIFEKIFTGLENILARMISDIADFDYEMLKDNVVLKCNLEKKKGEGQESNFIVSLDKENILKLEVSKDSDLGIFMDNMNQIFAVPFQNNPKNCRNLVAMLVHFNFYKSGNPELDVPLTRFCIRGNDESCAVGLNNLLVSFLNTVRCEELSKTASKESKPKFIAWGTLLNCSDITKIPEIIKRLMPEEEQTIFLNRLKKVLTDESFREEATESQYIREWELKEEYRTGKKDGINLGIELERCQIIEKLLKKDISISIIAEVTNQSTEDIKEFQEYLSKQQSKDK